MVRFNSNLPLRTTYTRMFLVDILKPASRQLCKPSSILRVILGINSLIYAIHSAHSQIHQPSLPSDTMI
jgi:hypothetical protein